ncbi:MAG: hypothetical protein JJU02_16440 [Cryomorphaceae bacterium]|nr:hypothetical protein [Cryomorphaceae bacterium]
MLKHIFILLISAVAVHGQTFKQKSALKSATNYEKTIFVAEKPIEVFTQPKASPEGWFMVRIHVMVKKSHLDEEEETIGKDAEVYNLEGEKIGELMMDVPYLEKGKAASRKNRDKWEVIIEGQAFKTQFERNTIPEEALSNLFNSVKRGMISKEVDQLLAGWDLPYNDLGDFTFFPIYREHYSLDNKNAFKMILVYKKGGTFYGIVTNEFQLDIPTKSQRSEGDIHFYFPTQKATDKDFEAIFNFVFEFIPL